MSLFVTIQVTRTSTYLEQIHQLTVTNTGRQMVLADGSLAGHYRVALDGEVHLHVWHNPDDGALALIEKALKAYGDNIA